MEAATVVKASAKADASGPVKMGIGREGGLEMGRLVVGC